VLRELPPRTSFSARANWPPGRRKEPAVPAWLALGPPSPKEEVPAPPAMKGGQPPFSGTQVPSSPEGAFSMERKGYSQTGGPPVARRKTPEPFVEKGLVIRVKTEKLPSSPFQGKGPGREKASFLPLMGVKGLPRRKLVSPCHVPFEKKKVPSFRTEEEEPY